MPIDYERLKSWPIPDQVNAYDERDCMLYAMGLGYGADPLDASELPFVFERDLRVVPSLFTVIGAPGAWATDPGTGIDWMQILHGEHRMTLHGLPPANGVLRSQTRVASVVDKGVGRGALVITERTISDSATGERLATIEHTSFCRADGGIGRSDEAPPALPPTPETAPDISVSLPALPSAALLYRLNGDRNPIHADPVAARKAGFDRPILHGLCTYGVAAAELVRHVCDHDPSRLVHLEARFSAPVYPGERLSTEIWIEGDSVHFSTSVPARSARVLSNGRAVVTPSSTRK